MFCFPGRVSDGDGGDHNATRLLDGTARLQKGCSRCENIIGQNDARSWPEPRPHGMRDIAPPLPPSQTALISDDARTRESAKRECAGSAHQQIGDGVSTAAKGGPRGRNGDDVSASSMRLTRGPDGGSESFAKRSSGSRASALFQRADGVTGGSVETQGGVHRQRGRCAVTDVQAHDNRAQRLSACLTERARWFRAPRTLDGKQQRHRIVQRMAQRGHGDSVASPARGRGVPGITTDEGAV